MTMTGNSFAAAHLTGIAALVRSRHPRLRPFQVKAVLWAAAANVREAPRAAGRFSTTMRRATVSLAADVLRGVP
jgi:subtilisin family serine protease